MGTVFLRGNSWVCEYRVNGKVHRKTLGKKGIITKTQAREMLKEIERKIALGEFDLLPNHIPTLGEFAKEYLAYQRDTVKKRSWRRDEGILKHLCSFFGDRKLKDITPKDIDDYKQVRLKVVEPATVNRELSTLRHLFNLAERWGMFHGKNPVSISRLLPENNQKERILTYEEEERLLKACNPSLRAIVTCALHTGMRKSEILTLKWENVDLENNVITIEHTNTKTKRTRRIPINQTLRTLLLKQRLKSGGSEYVFLSEAGKPYKFHDSLKGAFERACKKAGIEGLRFHDLRHTCATRMIEAGASIVAVSRILGHSDIKMTMRYSHPDSSLKEAVELLSKKIFERVTDNFTDNG